VLLKEKSIIEKKQWRCLSLDVSEMYLSSFLIEPIYEIAQKDDAGGSDERQLRKIEDQVRGHRERPSRLTEPCEREDAWYRATSRQPRDVSGLPHHIPPLLHVSMDRLGTFQ
jgi:hypothetical protein